MKYLLQTPTNRRLFLKKSAALGAGFTLALVLPKYAAGDLQDAAETKSSPGSQPDEANAFVRIGTDNTVTVIIKHIEFGQGTYTGLATLVAEELDANWDQVVSESAPVNKERYANSMLGGQGTGGSTAIANSYLQMREAGAAARTMLVAAAAERWQVSAAKITVVNGVVSHNSSKRSATFGELAEDAIRQQIPRQVKLKDPSDFTLIGRDMLARKDLGKTDGSAIFTQDIQLPGMLTALVAHPPRFGSKVKGFDPKPALAIEGVVSVVEIPTGVAVIADSFWQANRGRNVLKVEWDFSSAMTQSSADQMSDYKVLAQQPGLTVTKEGDSNAAFARATKIVEAEYEFPYLAHATMEPMNCVVQINKQDVQVWHGCQSQSQDQAAIAGALGVVPDTVKIKTLFAGGSFGRRASTHSDYPIEAALIAKAHGGGVPIKLVWTREDDHSSGYFRPMYFHKLKAGLDGEGKIIAWQHRIVGQSIFANSRLAAYVKNGIDPSSVEGAKELPYQIPNVSVELKTTESPVPVLWWRSVGSTHTAYAAEAFMDELARAAGKDPLRFRLAHLVDDSRYKTVLELAAEKAGWGQPLQKGSTRGIALHKSFGTYVAQVAELSINADGAYKVEKVNCAVDCGVAVNPDIIRTQMEGGIGYGLSPILGSEITIENGGVKETNFDRYKVLRIKQMPRIDVHIVKSAEAPTGVGEPSTPVIGPAVANALYAHTGKQSHRLPIGDKIPR